VTEMEISVPFTVSYESSGLSEHQEAGHFVSGGVKGDTVHIMTMTVAGTQILRMQADRADKVETQMRNAIAIEFETMVRQLHLAQFDREQFDRLNYKRNQLAIFIQDNYTWESSQGHHTNLDVVDVAIMYLRKERRRWITRLLALFHRLQPVPRPEPRHTGPPSDDWREK
jgi:hypothetical protein